MATLQEQFVVDAKGKKTGVILSLKRYQRLMEDLHDLAVVAGVEKGDCPLFFSVWAKRVQLIQQ